MRVAECPAFALKTYSFWLPALELSACQQQGRAAALSWCPSTASGRSGARSTGLSRTAGRWPAPSCR